MIPVFRTASINSLTTEPRWALRTAISLDRLHASRALLVLLFIVCLSIPAMAKGIDETHAPTDAERNNIERAIDFIEKMGRPDLAKKFRNMLKQGKIRIWNGDESSQITMDYTILLAKSRVRGYFYDATDFKGDQGPTVAGNTRDVFNLARTLIHELYHIYVEMGVDEKPIGVSFINEIAQGWALSGQERPEEVIAYDWGLRFGEQWIEWLFNDYKQERAIYYRYVRLRNLIQRMLNGQPLGRSAYKQFPMAYWGLLDSYSRTRELGDNQKLALLRLLQRRAQAMFSIKLFTQLENKSRAIKMLFISQTTYAMTRDGFSPEGNKLEDNYEEREEESSEEWDAERERIEEWEQRTKRQLDELNQQTKALTQQPSPPDTQNMHWSPGYQSVGHPLSQDSQFIKEPFLHGPPGTVEPGSTVTIQGENGKAITVKADDKGGFVVRKSDLPEGFDPNGKGNRIKQKRADGKESDWVEMSLTPATPSQFGQSTVPDRVGKQLTERPADDLPPSRDYFTDVATHYHEVAKHLVARGDLSRLAQLRDRAATHRNDLQANRADLADEDSSNDMVDLQIAELTQLASLVEQVNERAEQLKSRLQQANQEVDPADDPLSQLPIALTETIQEHVSVSEPRHWNPQAVPVGPLVRELIPHLVAEAAQSRQTSQANGTSTRTKGGAVVGEAQAMATTTIKITTEPSKTGSEDAATAQTDTTTVRPDAQGQFEFEVPAAGWSDIQVGGPELTQERSQVPAWWGRMDASMQSISYDQLESLDPEQWQRLARLGIVTGLLGPVSLNIPLPFNVDLQDLSVEELAQIGLFGLGLISAMSPEDFDIQDLLSVEEALEQRMRSDNAPIGLPLMQQYVSDNVTSEVAETMLQALGLQLAASHKPTQIAIDAEGDLSDQQMPQIRSELAGLVQNNLPAGSSKEDLSIETKRFSLPDEIGGATTLLYISVDDRGRLDRAQFGQSLQNWANSHPNIRSAELARPRVAETQIPNDPYYHRRGSWGQDDYDQWACRRIGFTPLQGVQESAWSQVDTQQAPVVVAVIGSGVDWTHPEFAGQIWVNPAEVPDNGKDDDGNGYADDLFGWNFRDENADVLDRGGHETHVAGIIAARWNNGVGIAGVNPHASIMPVKVANYLGQANSIDVSRAIFYAVDQGAQVINISYGGKEPALIEQRAVDYANSRGVLVVIAAGNKATNAADYGLASVDRALTVAGTDKNDERAGFSNWGLPVDLAAPATDILSLRAHGTDFLLYVGENQAYDSGSSIVGDDQRYYVAGGTSFAAPFVSGTASLLWALSPELSLEQVRHKLIMGARDVETPGWDQRTGAGIIDARRAIDADPDHYLFARITSVTAVRRGADIVLQVKGDAVGSELTGRWLQIGFGQDPVDDDWVTLNYAKDTVEGGVLGIVPSERLTKPGTWTVRLIVQDKREVVRSARATINAQ